MTRLGFAVTTCAATLLVALSSFFHPVPKMLWNASASVPIGLYAVRRAPPLQVGELVVVKPPMPLARFLAARRYLPFGVPLQWARPSNATASAVLCLPGKAAACSDPARFSS
jgi:type IV secretory pathway protease TraF